MIRVLFWNIKDTYNAHRLDLLRVIGAQCDIIILAEAYSNTIDNAIPGYSLIQPLPLRSRQWIKFFKNNASVGFSLDRVDDMLRRRVTIARLQVPGKMDVSFYGLHLKSKVNLDERTQTVINSQSAREIYDSMKHNRCILAGDFNHNPYESFMISPLMMNSVSNKRLAQDVKYRAYDYKRRTVFYNPMWNFLGDYDMQAGVFRYNGTHFYESTNHHFLEHVHWNLFDQVLVSEPISDSIDPKDIKVIASYTDPGTGIVKTLADDTFYSTNQNYLNPDYSDHLPIKFVIDTTKFI